VLGDDFGLMMLAVENERYMMLVATTNNRRVFVSLPLRGLGIFGSGWQIQTCAVESPLLALVCTGVVS
jgi:hypothetical protein